MLKFISSILKRFSSYHLMFASLISCVMSVAISCKKGSNSRFRKAQPPLSVLIRQMYLLLIVIHGQKFQELDFALKFILVFSIYHSRHRPFSVAPQTRYNNSSLSSRSILYSSKHSALISNCYLLRTCDFWCINTCLAIACQNTNVVWELQATLPEIVMAMAAT